MIPLTGRKIGDYTIGALIASGGMGDIYMANRDGETETVVMKVIRGDLQAKPDFRKRFLREIRLLVSLQHEHIIPILDWGYKRKTLYYTMKKIQGPTLGELLTKTNFTPEKSREILAPLAEALDYMHRQGIMHRDIKPANILLEKDGAGWRVYLSDFGLGKNPQRDKLLPMIRRSMGTVEFMSPESVAAITVDYRADIYSLTALAYEMLLGIRPHRLKKDADGSVAQQVLLLPSLINAEFPYPLEAVLIQGMEFDRERRFQSARAFISAYDDALSQLTEEQRDTMYQTIFKQKAHFIT
jgi:serine/threonine-protein kinase